MKTALYIFILCGIFTNSILGQPHPNLTLTSAGVEEIRKNLGTVAYFDEVLNKVREEVDAEIKLGVLVPIPKDMAGGYTHERHKRNFFILQKAGNLFQITQDEKYAKYIKDNLMAYAKMYPNLSLHPTKKSYATGKIFWQCLNDANWLVYVSQAYDCIYDWLSEEDRIYLEKDLFRPFAEFLSVENPKFFNRIHNHSTWANAAVGMIGLAMRDQDLIDRALYGLPINQGIDLSKDNDGGFIYEKGMSKAGFLAQLDNAFAPNGYFTEGPYYLRYAIFPFLIFSKSLDNMMPELDIMNYRDGIMQKAVFALLNQTDDNGVFFPINDSQKGMSWKARELVTALDIMYSENPKNTSLLSIAERQEQVLLDDTGFAVAKAITDGKATPYHQTPMIYEDGKDGDEGGVAILRVPGTCLVLKYSSQGMGHGHFDKLSYSLYDDVGEVLQDYGSARWVNIDQKGGGRYLLENKTFAKQTIAHNTLVANETSHYNGDIEKGEAHNPELIFSDLTNTDAQIISTKDTHAYDDVDMHRTMILLDDESLSNPLVIDILKATSESHQTYDVPFWYMGHLLSTNFEYKRSATLDVLGDSHGYQHLWKEATGHPEKSTSQFTWFGHSKFFTLSFNSDMNDEIILARAGANDPEYNLRSDPVFIQRVNNKKNRIFVSVIESHGTYNYVSELPINPFSEIQDVKVLYEDENYSIVMLSKHDGPEWTIAISNHDMNKEKNHSVKTELNNIEWQGHYKIWKK
jgi:hypothetical protein